MSQKFDRRKYFIRQICWGLVDASELSLDYFDQDPSVALGLELLKHFDDEMLKHAAFVEHPWRNYFEWNNGIPVRVNFESGRFEVTIVDPQKDYTMSTITDEKRTYTPAEIAAIVKMYIGVDVTM